MTINMERDYPFWLAAVCADAQKARRLIDSAVSRGLDPNADCGDETHTGLYWAAFGGNPDIVRAFLDVGACPNGEQWGRGTTSLHAAVENNDLDVLRLLLAAPCDRVIDYFDEALSRTPLIIAAKNDFIEAARMLLDAGADPNVDVGPHRIRDTPVAHAAMHASVQMVETLLDAGADPTLPGWMQLTAIHRAQQRGSGDGEQMLKIMQHTTGITDELWPNYLLKQPRE